MNCWRDVPPSSSHIVFPQLKILPASCMWTRERSWKKAHMMSWWPKKENITSSICPSMHRWCEWRVLVAKLDIAGVCACAWQLNAWIPVIGKISPSASRFLYDNRGNAGGCFLRKHYFFLSIFIYISIF